MIVQSILGPRGLAIVADVGFVLACVAFLWGAIKLAYQRTQGQAMPRNLFTKALDVGVEAFNIVWGVINRAVKLDTGRGLFLPTLPADGSPPSSSAATIDAISSENAALRAELAAYQRRVSESHAVTAPGVAHPAQVFAPDFDPTARQTIVPEVAAQIASETLPRDPSQRGSISLRALLAIVVGLAVVLPLGVGLYGCPRNPPVSGCQPEAQTCIHDRPHVCSASQRWHVAGDRSCASIGGVCTVLGGRAYCGPVADAGADAGDAE